MCLKEQKLNARELALKVLIAVEEREAYANLALRSLFEKENPSQLDRAFISELVYGTLRKLNTIDWILDQFIKQPLTRQSIEVRNILRLGVYQLLYLDRVPASAICNEGANLARRYGHEGIVKFVNGVLRNIQRKKNTIKYPDPSRDPVNYIAIKYSHPPWIVQKWIKLYGVEETEKLCEANNKSTHVIVRTNTLKLHREELLQKLEEEGLKAKATLFAPEGVLLEGVSNISQCKAYVEGLMQVQDESSMLVGHALSPEPGSKVIDMASAPGGKTTHLAQLMNNKGQIVACDIYVHKLELVMDNCKRLGITIVNTHKVDARELSKYFSNWADYVLLDAPCSGLGVLRRRPEVRWRKNEIQINELALLQRQMLEEAGQCLVPGGVMVYSTCTITHEENINMIEKFLSANNAFELVSLKKHLPSGLGDLKKGYIQLLPHIHNMDGFFIARIRKKDIKNLE